jgi:hypothetical protein
MDTIHRESRNLVDSLISCTENDGSVYPLKYLELNSLNVICAASFGRRYDSIYDPEYEKMASLVNQGIKFAEYGDDFVFTSVFDFILRRQAKIRDYMSKRNATFRQLIRQATLREGTNLIKSLEENDCGLSEDDTLVLMCMLSFSKMDIHYCCRN